MDFAENFQKNVVINSKLNFFRYFSIFLTCFGCVLHANTTNKKLVNLCFTKPFFCHIQSLKRIGCDRDFFPSRRRRDLKPSRPRPRLAKMSLEASLESETKPRDYQLCIENMEIMFKNYLSTSELNKIVSIFERNVFPTMNPDFMCF